MSSNERPETIKKIATVKFIERRLSPLKKIMYVITFLAEDGDTYTKTVVHTQPHWQKMFFNMGQDEPDYANVEPMIGNKVELVINKETNICMYVNRLSVAQQLELSKPDKILAEPGMLDKVKEFLGAKK